MIELHRLSRGREPLHVNPDLIVTVEATPDTVLHLATGAKLVVSESPEEVGTAVRAFRASVLLQTWQTAGPAPEVPPSAAEHQGP